MTLRFSPLNSLVEPPASTKNTLQSAPLSVLTYFLLFPQQTAIISPTQHYPVGVCQVSSAVGTELYN
jgi:hypothetical protein